jgi:hypothetical protein
MAWLSAMLPNSPFREIPGGCGQQKRRAVGPTLINGSHSDPGICREYRDFQPGGKDEVSLPAILDILEQNRYNPEMMGRRVAQRYRAATWTGLLRNKNRVVPYKTTFACNIKYLPHFDEA